MFYLQHHLVVFFMKLVVKDIKVTGFSIQMSLTYFFTGQLFLWKVLFEKKVNEMRVRTSYNKALNLPIGEASLATRSTWNILKFDESEAAQPQSEYFLVSESVML